MILCRFTIHTNLVVFGHKYSIPQFEEEFDVSWSEVENDLPSKAEWEESERRNAELENQMLEDWIQ